MTNNGFFRVSEEVREALNSKKPVVALESTIYTHGAIEEASVVHIVVDRPSRLPVPRERSPRIPP